MIRPGYDVFYTQFNLPNIIKCKNKCFFFFYIQIQDLNIE